MKPHHMALALRESAENLRDYDRWTTLAWIDIKLRYRRTMLGPLWLTLSTGVLIGSVGLVWGGIFGVGLKTYMPFFAVGIIMWTMISGTLTEGCNVFTQAASLIKSLPTPLMVHVYRLLARQSVILAHNAVLIAVLWAFIQWPLGASTWLALAGIAINMIALTGGVLLLGILCTRFRDIPQIVAALLQLLFLLTPVMWMPESIRGKVGTLLLDWNPFHYLLHVVRGPLLGQPPTDIEWAVAIIVAVVSLVAGLAIYGRFQHRVAYWL